MEYERVNVETVVRFAKDGGMRPLYIVWEDGRTYEIERIRFIERAPARVSAVLPVRFTCVMGGTDKYLYYEAGSQRWFVERPRL